MGIITNAANREAVKNTKDAPSNYAVEIGGKKYEVVDGDTLRDSTGLRLRVRGLLAPEVTHQTNREGTQHDVGEIGGEYGKDALFNVLSEQQFDTIEDHGVQTYGRGADDRHIISITNSKTGQGIKEYLLGAGLVDPDKLTTGAEIDAYNAGALRRQLYNEDKYAAMRGQKEINKQRFKTQALTTKDYVSGGGNSVYSGVAFKKANENLVGETTTPISTAFSTGYYSLLADLGGSLEAAGTLLGNEWLQDKGDYASFINEERGKSNPYQEIAALSDIGKSGDTFIAKTGDFFQWLGVNAAQSAPYLGALIGSSVATGGIAGVFGVGAGAAGTAAAVVSSGSSAAFHTGQIWNDLDNDKKTPKNAGIAMTLGTFAGALDRLSLGKLSGIKSSFKPQDLIGKKGREKIATYIAERDGTSKDIAMRKLLGAVKTETDDFLADSYNTTKGLISKQRVIQNLIASALPAIGTEASTEMLQELTTYITAQAINRGDVQDLDDVVDFITEELVGDDPQLREMLLNAGVAGGILGGGIHVAGGLRQTANASKVLADLDSSTSSELAPIAKLYYENSDIDQNIATSQADYHGRIQAGSETSSEAFDGKQVKGLSKRLTEYARTKTAASRLIDGTTTITKEFGRQAGKLYREEFLRVVPTKALEASQALRNWYSYQSGVRGTHAGQAFENQLATDLGVQKNITNKRILGKANKFNYKSEKAVEDFGAKMYRFGELTDGNSVKGIKAKKPSDLTNADLKEIGIDRSQVAQFEANKQLFENREKRQLDLRKTRLENVYGVGHPMVEKGTKELKGWWWKHREFDAAQIRGDKKGFKKIVKDAIRAKGNVGVSDAELRAYQNPEAFADALVGAVVDGKSFDEALGAQYSQLDGGATLPQARTLDLSQQKGIDKFVEKDIFKTLDSADDASFRNAIHLQYFGEDGGVVDLLANDAAKELKDAGFPGHEIIDMLSELSHANQGIIDAASGNYNPIKNPTLKAIQDNVLMFTGFIGMSLSAPASIPEYAAIMVGMRDNAAVSSYAQDVGNTAFKGLVRAVKNVGNRVKGDPHQDQDWYDFMLEIGLPDDAGYFQKKFGTGDVATTSERLRKVQEGFYTAIGLKGMTDHQRGLAVPAALDYMRYESDVLLNAGDRLKTKDLNSTEIQAFSKLQEIGIDVIPFIDMLKKHKSAPSLQSLVKGDTRTTDEALLDQLRVGAQAFANTRIQHPRAANRPLLLQDPRFRLLTQFNGFISSATTTLVPKLWNDQFGRGLRTAHPTLSYDAFALAVVMVLLGGFGQWLKDEVKFGESSPYLEGYGQYLQRALYSGGVLGQGEKILDFVHPLYAARQGTGEKLIGAATGSAGRTAQGIYDVFSPEEYDGTSAKAETINDVLKLVPGLSNLTNLRNYTVDKVDKLTGGS